MRRRSPRSTKARRWEPPPAETTVWARLGARRHPVTTPCRALPASIPAPVTPATPRSGPGGGCRRTTRASRPTAPSTSFRRCSAWRSRRGSAPGLRRVQNELFPLGADLCVREEDKANRPGPRIEARHVEALERTIDELNADLPALANFVLPGGSIGAAHLHVARTLCRRAERLLVTLMRAEAVGEHTLPYLNRLSDALFVMARWETRRRGVDDVLWDSRA